MTKLQRNRRKTIKLSPAQIFLACILSSTWRFSLSSLEVLSVSTWRLSWHKPAFHWRGWAGTNRSRSPTEMQHFYSGCISRWGFLIRLYFQVGIFDQVVFPGEEPGNTAEERDRRSWSTHTWKVTWFNGNVNVRS